MTNGPGTQSVESFDTNRVSNRPSDFYLNLESRWKFGLRLVWPTSCMLGSMFAAKGNSQIYHLVEELEKKTVCGLKVLKLSGPLTKYSSVQFTNKPPRGRKLCKHCKRIWTEASLHSPTSFPADVEGEISGVT